MVKIHPSKNFNIVKVIEAIVVDLKKNGGVESYENNET
jgi:hypothetical protein